MSDVGYSYKLELGSLGTYKENLEKKCGTHVIFRNYSPVRGIVPKNCITPPSFFEILFVSACTFKLYSRTVY